MFDLPTCLSKLLLLGYSLGNVVELATTAPAHILEMEGRGTLRPGAYADIALFHLLSGEFPLYDNLNEMRTGKQLLVNAQTIVAGRPMARRPQPSRPDWFEPWANAGTINHIINFQHELAKRGHDPAALASACGCHAQRGR
jgi:dihydroorotase